MKIAALTALAVSLAVGGCKDAPVLADAVVKVEMLKGHGSAVHIGDGFYLTAAHVVKDGEGVVLKADNGRARKAELLWSAPAYDISLMRADLGDIAAVKLNCRTPDRGEVLEFSGNPQKLEFVSTWGQGGGAVQKVGTHWAEAMPVSGPIIPGMSGGAVLDVRGDLVGINVGVMIMRVGFAGGPAGISYIVPGSTVCKLLGLL